VIAEAGGLMSLALESMSADLVEYSSREVSGTEPQLVILTTSGAQSALKRAEQSVRSRTRFVPTKEIIFSTMIWTSASKPLFKPASSPLEYIHTENFNWYYEYDGLYRLTYACSNWDDIGLICQGDEFTYTYDAVGNRTSQIINGLTTNYTYDSANRLTSVDGVTYTWDNNGNLLSDGINTYTYDYANRLSTMTDGVNTYEYEYNGLGNRIQQIVNSVTTTYQLDLNMGLPQVLSDGTSTYLYGRNRIGEGDTAWNYYLGDALGSMRQLIDSSGTVILAQTFEPYGEVWSSHGEGNSSYSFTGEMRDPSGLMYLRARYMAPAVGRFLTRDTRPGNDNAPLSLNRWMYAQGNPIRYTDPSGMNVCNVVDPVDYEACLAANDNTDVARMILRNKDRLWELASSSVTNGLQPGDYGVKGDARRRPDVRLSPPGLTWNNFSLPTARAPQFGNSQYLHDIDNNGVIDVGRPWGSNTCGQVAVSSVLNALLGENFTNIIMDTVETAKDGTTNAKQLAHSVAKLAYDGYPLDHIVYGNSMEWKVDENGNMISETHVESARGLSYQSVDNPGFVQWIMGAVSNGHYYISLVEIDTGNQGNLVDVGTDHWIVINGFSDQWNFYNMWSEKNWIRITNPFLHRDEYYWWPEFRLSIHTGPALEIWRTN
jgi:RHS repeat-associated protein